MSTHPTPQRHTLVGAPERRAADVTLVVGWNGQPDSIAAVHVAADLARRLHGHLHLVHIVDADDLPIDPDADDWGRELTATLDEQARRARAELDDLDNGWTYHAWHGDPADLLGRVADEVDAYFVVLGNPRAGVVSRLEAMTGGSVSHRMIHDRHRPVLLVPAN